MKWAGFIIELLLLGLGVYVYLFSRGVVKMGTGASAAKAEQFRKENSTLLRLLALALMAIMFINVAFSLSALL